MRPMRCGQGEHCAEARPHLQLVGGLLALGTSTVSQALASELEASHFYFNYIILGWTVPWWHQEMVNQSV